uniref:Uncharacterized protein n=1 Tax=Myotis myotis TaxID=51298 RepID=A0A7J7Z581_MYOMY|nr:hypothetical protein mMyoMyo1_010755 [Myotis myotis]
MPVPPSTHPFPCNHHIAVHVHEVSLSSFLAQSLHFPNTPSPTTRAACLLSIYESSHLYFAWYGSPPSLSQHHGTGYLVPRGRPQREIPLNRLSHAVCSASPFARLLPSPSKPETPPYERKAFFGWILRCLKILKSKCSPYCNCLFE